MPSVGCDPASREFLGGIDTGHNAVFACLEALALAHQPVTNPKSLESV